MMRILVGTEKGAYLLSETGSDWQVEGPMFPGWKVTAFGETGGTHVAGVGSNWFGVRGTPQRQPDRLEAQ